jgi:hypothetical protein
MTDKLVIKEMTRSDLEDLLNEAETTAKLAGFKSMDEMENYKVNASSGLIKFGGSFAQPLGYALAHADWVNTAKILMTFRDECNEHAALYIKWLEKRKETE